MTTPTPTPTHTPTHTPTTPRVSVVVVAYQSQRTIKSAMESLRLAHDAGVAETIFVDNACTDQTLELLEPARAWATILESPTNIGFGRGCNLGAASARSPYVLFLNPDAIMEPASIARMADFLDSHPRAAIVGPAIRDGDGSLQRAGRIPEPIALVREAMGKPAPAPDARVISPGEQPFETTWVSGAALMIRRDVFNQLHGFDPRFFLYFEETDLCVRTRRAGHEIWAMGGAMASHAQGESSRDQAQTHYSGCIAEHYFASRQYYLRKHHGFIAATAVEVCELVFLLARAMVRPGARRMLLARLRGPILKSPPKVTPA